ncbi:MAG: hypothetical protein NC238_01435 [Dehalobacter sp.]|nr:hypothetical protein [Dehalobacter sp.]
MGCGHIMLMQREQLLKLVRKAAFPDLSGLSSRQEHE